MSVVRTSERPLRRDAASSQARIVQAAGVVFAQEGFDAPLSQVAAAAGVGVATLSRHYTRAQLVEIVARQVMAEHVRVAEEALGLSAPDALFVYLRMLIERRLVDRSLCHAITLRFSDSVEVSDHRAELRRLQRKLIAAGQQAGSVRAGIVPQDLILTLEALQGVMETTTGDAGWKRLFAVLRAGLAPAAEGTPLPPPPKPDALLQAVTGPPRGRPPSPIYDPDDHLPPSR